MSTTNTVENVSTGAPKIGGYAFKAPLGTALPTDASTALNVAFVSLGFISEDGLSNDHSPETDNIKDWGGTTVLSPQTSRDDIWKFTLIESKNTDALKLIYGDGNVIGTLAEGMTVKAGPEELEYASFVFEMVLRGGTKRRTVLPNAKVTEVGTIVYNRTDAIGYEVTLTCAPDSAGYTHYDYMVNPSA